MSVGILLITHPGLGPALLKTVQVLVSDCPMQCHCMEVPLDAHTEAMLTTAADHLAELDTGDGVLVLTDVYGATPSNIACTLTQTGRVKVVSGVNLPMLIRIFNYAGDSLDALTTKAAKGGIRGIHIFSVRDTKVTQ